MLGTLTMLPTGCSLWDTNMTLSQFNEIVQAHNTYMSPSDYSKYATMSPADFEDAVKNTTTKLQTDTISNAQKNLDNLNLPPAYQDYAKANMSAAQGYQQAKESSNEYQLLQQAEKYQSEIIQKGPMYELAMRQDLARISPSFMGVSRESLREKLKSIEPNVINREKMIDTYMGYADKAMTMSLSTLGQLRDAAVIAAQTDVEEKKSIWEKVAAVYDEAYSTTLMANKSILENKLNPTKNLTQAEKDTSYIQQIAQKFDQSKQQKGGEYLDGNVYMEARRGFGGSPTEFDRQFSYMLSPQDQEKFLGKKPTETDEIPQSVIDIMSNPDASLEDLMNAYNSLP